MFGDDRDNRPLHTPNALTPDFQQQSNMKVAFVLASGAALVGTR